MRALAMLALLGCSGPDVQLGLLLTEAQPRAMVWLSDSRLAVFETGDRWVELDPTGASRLLLDQAPCPNIKILHATEAQVFMTCTAEVTTLVRLDTSGQTQVLETFSSGAPTSFAISGEKLAYDQQASVNNVVLRTLQQAGLSEPRAIHPTTQPLRIGAFSPDGDQLLFSVQRPIDPQLPQAPRLEDLFLADFAAGTAAPMEGFDELSPSCFGPHPQWSARGLEVRCTQDTIFNLDTKFQYRLALTYRRRLLPRTAAALWQGGMFIAWTFFEEDCLKERCRESCICERALVRLQVERYEDGALDIAAQHALEIHELDGREMLLALSPAQKQLAYATPEGLFLLRLN